MRKINPMLIAAAAVGVGAFVMSQKKGAGKKPQDCSKFYDEKGFMGYKVSESTAKAIRTKAMPLIMGGNKDVDALTIEVLSLLDADCDWGAVMTGDADDKTMAVIAAAQDIIMNLVTAAPPSMPGA